MADQTIAVPSDAVVDGVTLGKASDWTIAPRMAAAVRTNAHGVSREVIALADPGLPSTKELRAFVLNWSNIPPESRDHVGWIRATPGRHTLILWRPERLHYLGDGSRKEFTMPNSWRLAVDTGPVPPGFPVARLDPVVRIGLTGADKAYVLVSPATYAGTPPANTVWFLQGGSTFKLDAAPAVGAALYVRVVPRFSVLVDRSQTSTTLSRPIPEPGSLRLVE